MKNIFITGATSFIGINLIEELLKHNYNVTAIIRKNSKKKELLTKFENIKIVELNIEEIERLPEIIDQNCDVFYHLAWNGTRGKTRDDSILQLNNYKYSINALKTAHKMGAKLFVSAGSQAEYGLHDTIVSEETQENPVTQYGIYKLKFCNYAKEYCLENNIRFIEPRFFSLYGVGDFENTLIISAIDKMLKNQEIDLTKCIQMWNFLNIKDAVKALINLQNSNKQGVYNFGSEDTRMLKDFIDDMYRLTKSKSKINFGAIPYGSSGIINVNPSTLKLQKDANWKANIKFEDGIKEIIEKRMK